jgi:hypothetical protein
MGHGQLPGPTDHIGNTIAIDDGTSARTDAPPPGPIGLDAKGGGGSKQAAPSIADQIVSFARRRLGERVGDGECFTFVDRALSGAGAKSARDHGPVTPTADYVWGTAVTLTDLRPGDVIQFRDYSYDREVRTETDEDESVENETHARPHHTAIVERVDGNGAVTVLEQNAPPGSHVSRTRLFFSNQHVENGGTTTTIRVHGTWWFYRPEAR